MAAARGEEDAAQVREDAAPGELALVGPEPRPRRLGELAPAGPEPRWYPKHDPYPTDIGTSIKFYPLDFAGTGMP